nr:MAG TPA: Head Tail Connector Protein [Caudoviricetes sp.]
MLSMVFPSVAHQSLKHICLTSLHRVRLRKQRLKWLPLLLSKTQLSAVCSVILRCPDMYADYSYYTDSWAGTLIPAQEFNSYARKAERLINYIVSGGVKEVTEPVKNAVCAAAEAAYELRKSVENIPQGIKSENTDGYSVTYKDYNIDELTDMERRAMFNAIRQELYNTGLLYQGVR